MTASIPPAAIFFAGALLTAVLPWRARQAVFVLVPLAGGLNLWHVLQAPGLGLTFLDYRLEFLRVDSLSLLFGILFHIAALIGAIFALHVRDRVQQCAALAYAGAALGAVFAGDLVTFFLFSEVMAVASVFLIWARRTPRAIRAGLRYLFVQVAAGLVLLAGTLVLISDTGSASFGFIGLAGLGGGLVFAALGIKCAFPLVHTWLTDAYPEATPTGAVFLSSFTTKVAIYGLARAFPGAEPLIYIGTAMAVFPIFYAVIENDLRRVLGYSMINQLGFMVVGIGIGTDLALNGAVAHAFNEVIFKGLLFMSMGAVLHQTGKINGSDLGGLYKTMPATTGLCMVGAASISAFPLFSGFVSKSLIMAAAIGQGHWQVWLLLLFASAGVFHHAGIKIPYFAFFAHDSGIRTREPPANMLAGMALGAALCVLVGTHPALLYALLPYGAGYIPYTLTHVINQVQLLFFAALAFAWLNLSGIYPPELRAINLDADWFYRGLVMGLVRRADRVWARLEARTRPAIDRRLRAGAQVVERLGEPAGALGGAWMRIGTTALWVAVLLAAYLLAYFL